MRPYTCEWACAACNTSLKQSGVPHGEGAPACPSCSHQMVKASAHRSGRQGKPDGGSGEHAIHYVTCRGKGSCGERWNYAGRTRCRRCNRLLGDAKPEPSDTQRSGGAGGAAAKKGKGKSKGGEGQSGGPNSPLECALVAYDLALRAAGGQEDNPAVRAQQTLIDELRAKKQEKALVDRPWQPIQDKVTERKNKKKLLDASKGKVAAIEAAIAAKQAELEEQQAQAAAFEVDVAKLDAEIAAHGPIKADASIEAWVPELVTLPSELKDSPAVTAAISACQVLPQLLANLRKAVVAATEEHARQQESSQMDTTETAAQAGGRPPPPAPATPKGDTAEQIEAERENDRKELEAAAAIALPLEQDADDDTQRTVAESRKAYVESFEAVLAKRRRRSTSARSTPYGG